MPKCTILSFILSPAFCGLNSQSHPKRFSKPRQGPTSTFQAMLREEGGTFLLSFQWCFHFVKTFLKTLLGMTRSLNRLYDFFGVFALGFKLPTSPLCAKMGCDSSPHAHMHRAGCQVLFRKFRSDRSTTQGDQKDVQRLRAHAKTRYQ